MENVQLTEKGYQTLTRPKTGELLDRLHELVVGGGMKKTKFELTFEVAEFLRDEMLTSMERGGTHRLFSESYDQLDTQLKKNVNLK